MKITSAATISCKSEYRCSGLVVTAVVVESHRVIVTEQHVRNILLRHPCFVSESWLESAC